MTRSGMAAAERGRLGALDGDELRHELAEQDVGEREQRERDDGDDHRKDVRGRAARDGERDAVQQRRPGPARQSSRGPGWPA